MQLSVILFLDADKVVPDGRSVVVLVNRVARKSDTDGSIVGYTV
jgi:hypothetical protein